MGCLPLSFSFTQLDARMNPLARISALAVVLLLAIGSQSSAQYYYAPAQPIYQWSYPVQPGVQYYPAQPGYPAAAYFQPVNQGWYGPAPASAWTANGYSNFNFSYPNRPVLTDQFQDQRIIPDSMWATSPRNAVRQPQISNFARYPRYYQYPQYYQR
jgi:hypothetical protein